MLSIAAEISAACFERWRNEVDEFEADDFGGDELRPLVLKSLAKPAPCCAYPSLTPNRPSAWPPIAAWALPARGRFRTPPRRAAGGQIAAARAPAFPSRDFL